MFKTISFEESAFTNTAQHQTMDIIEMSSKITAEEEVAKDDKQVTVAVIQYVTRKAK
jgi:hypothetical protein